MNTIRRNGGRWSFEKKKRRIGYAFIASWLIGFFLLYAKPLVESLVYTCLLYTSDAADEL